MSLKVIQAVYQKPSCHFKYECTIDMCICALPYFFAGTYRSQDLPASKRHRQSVVDRDIARLCERTHLPNLTTQQFSSFAVRTAGELGNTGLSNYNSNCYNGYHVTVVLARSRLVSDGFVISGDFKNIAQTKPMLRLDRDFQIRRLGCPLLILWVNQLRDALHQSSLRIRGTYLEGRIPRVLTAGDIEHVCIGSAKLSDLKSHIHASNNATNASRRAACRSLGTPLVAQLMC